MIKNKIYVPHIDKTGGQSVERMLMRAMRDAEWTYTHNGGDRFPQTIPSNYGRVGMHQEYRPEIIDDDWFKLLIIRDPLDRFISAFNFYHYEVYRDTGQDISLSIEEFCRYMLLRHTPDWRSVPQELSYQRGYVSMLTSLNAEQSPDGFRFTHDNIFDVFDHVTTTEYIDELDEVFEPLGLELDTSIHVNYAGQHIPDPEDVFTRPMLTDAERACIGIMPDFVSDQKLWSLYANSK